MGILDKYLNKKRKKLNLQIASKPNIVVPEKVIDKGFDALFDRLLKNLTPPLGNQSDITARPSPRFFGAWLWDSAFISQAWKLRAPIIGLRILKTFVEFQARNGRMAHMIYRGKKVSPLSNPPFLAWAVKNLTNWYFKEDFIKYFLEPVKKFAEWRKVDRLNENYNLYFWQHSYESGIDNTPRFTSVDEKLDYGTNNLGAIDLNSEIVLQHDAILGLMDRIGTNNDRVIVEKNMTELMTAINNKLWNSSQKIYGDLEFNTGNLRCIDTIASYFPLIFPKLDINKLEHLVKNLQNVEKYNTKFPLPTIARDSEYFTKDMWRGPVWLNTTYLVIWGLKRNGYGKLAGELAYKASKGVYETWNNEGSFYEFYDPDRYDIKELHRKKGNLYKQITLGSKPVKKFAGWTANANNMLIENVIGLNREEGKWSLEPHLPEDWLGKDSIVLKIPFYQIELVIKSNKASEDLEIDFMLNGENFSSNLSNHTKINLL